MGWTNPTVRSSGTLITASIYNTDLVYNLQYLKEERDTLRANIDALGYHLAEYTTANLSSNFSTTSTSFVDVLTLTSPTLVSGDVLEVTTNANFYISRTALSAHALFQLLVNGVSYPLPIQYIAAAGATSIAHIPLSIKTKMIAGLTGAIPVKLQCKTGNGETMTCQASSYPEQYQGEIIAKVWRPA